VTESDACRAACAETTRGLESPRTPVADDRLQEVEIVIAQIGNKRVVEPDLLTIAKAGDDGVRAVLGEDQIIDGCEAEGRDIHQIKPVLEIGHGVDAVAEVEDEGIVTKSAGQHVVTGTTVQDIVQIVADENVISASANDEYIIGAIDDDIDCLHGAILGVDDEAVGERLPVIERTNRRVGVVERVGPYASSVHRIGAVAVDGHGARSDHPERVRRIVRR